MGDEYTVIAGLGRKIGINRLAMQDFDLVFADASSIEKFCDQFELIELSAKERFHFMQLIVASLDRTIETNVHFADTAVQRVERLLSDDPQQYEYIIDYWANTGGEDGGTSLRPMMRRLLRQWNLTALPFSSP